MSLNTLTPACTNKVIHLKASTMDAPEGWFTYLLRINSKARSSFKQRQLIGSDAVSGTELIPDLSVIVHGWIVKGGRVRVKGIVGGYGYLNP